MATPLSERILARQPEAIVRKLRLFLWLIDLIARLRGLRPFRALSPQQQERLLRNLSRSPVAILRKGMSGVVILCKAGIYSQAEVHQQLGYRQRPFVPSPGPTATAGSPHHDA